MRAGTHTLVPACVCVVGKVQKWTYTLCIVLYLLYYTHMRRERGNHHHVLYGVVVNPNSTTLPLLSPWPSILWPSVCVRLLDLLYLIPVQICLKRLWVIPKKNQKGHAVTCLCHWWRIQTLKCIQSTTYDLWVEEEEGMSSPFEAK